MKEYNTKNSAELKAKKKLFRKANKEAINADWKLRFNTDLNFRIAHNLRTRMGKMIKRGNKAGSAVKDLGCTIEELKLWLESKWLTGMNWENHSTSGWHIDHIKPLSSFDLTNPEQFKKAAHYTNLQPLWAEANISKGGTNRIKSSQECPTTF